MSKKEENLPVWQTIIPNVFRGLGRHIVKKRVKGIKERNKGDLTLPNSHKTSWGHNYIYITVMVRVLFQLVTHPSRQKLNIL